MKLHTSLILLVLIVLTACTSQADIDPAIDSVAAAPNLSTPVLPTPLPTRPQYSPGQLVDYIAKTGDTLPALASHFNTTVSEIRAANPIIPPDVTTLPPGFPMQIPIYYLPLWGSPYQILPDSHFIYGPSTEGFSTVEFVNQNPGWLKEYRTYAADANRSGAEMVEYIALNFSINPRLLLAILDYQLGALSNPTQPPDLAEYPLGFNDRNHKGLYLQLVWAANILNNGYYGWRTGTLSSFLLQSGKMVRLDPWQNAASVALQSFYALILSEEDFNLAISGAGLYQTYSQLFADPWINDTAHIPGSLRQPELRLPFETGKRWAFTGGPHTGWGEGEPLAAIDFAPPAVVGGCSPSNEWVTAMASGVIARAETGIAVLDLDSDGNEATGWVIFYLHLGRNDAISQGTIVSAGDKIGHPSCERGRSTGTHIHIARKYNGEWIPADGPLAFNLEGWVAHNGDSPYKGTLTRFSQVVTACLCSNQESQIESQQ